VSRRFWGLVLSDIAAALLLLEFARSGNDARLLLLFLGFLPTWDAYTRSATWGWAAERLCRVNARLLHVDGFERCMTLYGDMVVACAGAPPTPPEIYNRSKVELNRLWLTFASTMAPSSAEGDPATPGRVAPHASTVNRDREHPRRDEIPTD
jgi:hypothetical protein